MWPEGLSLCELQEGLPTGEWLEKCLPLDEWLNGGLLIGEWLEGLPHGKQLEYILVGELPEGLALGKQDGSWHGVEQSAFLKLANNLYTLKLLISMCMALGAIGPKSLAFIRDLGYRMKQRTGEERALRYLLQRLSVAIQRGNSASAMGSIGN